jgi:hypothetical protein
MGFTEWAVAEPRDTKQEGSSEYSEEKMIWARLFASPLLSLGKVCCQAFTEIDEGRDNGEQK